MSNENNEPIRKAFICFLDDKDQKREGYVDILKLDQFMVRFRTRGNIITIPLARVLKIKEKDEEVEG